MSSPGTLAHRSANALCQVTLVTVVHDDPRFFEANLELTRDLNPRLPARWIVVDNTPGFGLPDFDVTCVERLPGAAAPESRDLGSLHHAMGLEKALGDVSTRFVLFLDPDFYVLRRDWLAAVTEWVRGQAIGIFGAVWDPRWFYQYRGFPSVHFMLIDLERIPREGIDLKPSISEDAWWLLINNDRLLLPRWLRETLKAGRCRDTGWKLYRDYHLERSVHTETLLPHYAPPSTGRYRLEQWLKPILSASIRKYPSDPGSYTEESFLETGWPAAYDQGWEEFFWQGQPFAVHLRRVGRAMLDRSPEQDHKLLPDLKAHIFA